MSPFFARARTDFDVPVGGYGTAGTKAFPADIPMNVEHAA